MAYKQLKQFYPSDMGTKKGMCLENVARGYHIYGVPSAQPSAKADMEFNKARGTLHPLNTLPTNVAVPVYLDTSSKYEHVEVSDKGVFWSDGKKVSKPTSNCFGWGEYCNGVRIVEWQNDPQPSTGFLPPKGYWGRYDKDTRVAELASFMRRVFLHILHPLLLVLFMGIICGKVWFNFRKTLGLMEITMQKLMVILVLRLTKH